MKNILTTTIASLFFILVTPSSQAAEKGIEMVQEVTLSGPQDMKFEVTTKALDHLMRMDMQGFSTIIDSISGDIITLMHDQKMFVKLPKSLAGVFQQGNKEPAEMPEFTATGREEIISGKLSREYEGSYDGQPFTLWLTKDSGLSDAALKTMAKLEGEHDPFQGNARFLAHEDGFPMRIETETSEGKMQMTVLSIEEKNLSPGDFVAPPSYRTLEIPKELGDILQQFQ